jgi:hypothetical protein
MPQAASPRLGDAAQQLRSVRVINVGHAFIQTVRREHYEQTLGINCDCVRELALAV